jgi:UDP-glucose 4-epimerase
MKALITGGAGFIGSHLAEALCRRGAKVVVLDNLSTGTPANLAWRKSGDALEFVNGDLLNAPLVRDLMAGCDWVFHEAAIASVPQSVAQPIEANRANLDGSLELLVAARDARVKRFLFASSSAIYGDSEAPVKHEAHAPNPISPYGLQKYAAERYGQLFFQLYGLETVSLRYFNVFGPRQSFNSPYSGVIARFCTAVLQGKAPIIFGDGLQSRDFIYVENVVVANLLAAEGAGARVAGKTFNIAGGQSITLLQLAAELNRLTGQNLTPHFEPPRTGDVRASQADISAARRDMDYEVRAAWQEGLKKTLDFYRT